MDTPHPHVDEISVWSWIAAWVFAVIALAAMLFSIQGEMRITGLGSALPFAHSVLLPSQAPADPRA
jgi:hypothetical protein